MQTELQKNESHNDIPGITAVFIFAAAIHIILQFTVFNFSRSIIVYPDELRYYEIARSLFNSGGLQIRGIDSTFQKIGYSLILAPLFAVHDVVLRLKITGILNAIIMSLSVIFVWLICRELKLNRRVCYVIAFFTAIYPDMMYSMTCMSEVLYWPVLLIYIYTRMINERRNSYIISVIEGLICYFGYLTKEIFLAFLIASVLFEFIYPMLNYYIFPENRAGRKLKDFYSRKILIKTVIFIAVFMLCYITMKLSLFRGMGNSYNQMGIEAIMSPYKFMYCVYAFFHYIAALIAASLVIPFVYPAVNFRSMNENARKLFCYVILFSLIISGVIAYTISVREDLGFEYARIHLRYYGAAFIMLLAVFSSCMQDLDSNHEIHEIIRKRNRTLI